MLRHAEAFVAAPIHHSFVTSRFALTLPTFSDRADVRVLTAAFETLNTFAAHLTLDNTFTSTNRFEAPTSMTQPVTLSAHPTQAMEAATRQYCEVGVGPPITFPLRAPDDSATAPSYSFAASPGTGMFRPTGINPLIRFATNGQQRWEISQDGHLVAAIGCSLELTDPGASGTYPGIRFGSATVAPTTQCINLPNSRGISFRSPISGSYVMGTDNGNDWTFHGGWFVFPQSANPPITTAAGLAVMFNGTLRWIPLYL